MKKKKVIETYRKIYDQGVEPKVFINDFLELIYYFKNINSLTLESTNFALNDEEFLKIKRICSNIDSSVLILFWQYTIKTLGELDIVSNQNLSIEMFLMRLMHLSSFNYNNDNHEKEDSFQSEEKKNIISEFKIDTIEQIKNITQEKKIKPEIQKEIKSEEKFSINSFEQLLEMCSHNKEAKLRYELENNVNLVSFEKNRVEISFNDYLDKNFVKDLSLKLFEWTGKRWIITFSKLKGDISIKEKQQNKKNLLIEKAKESELYKNVLEKFKDADLFEVTKKLRD